MNTPKLAEALCKAQAVMSGAKKDKKNPFFKSSYADLASAFAAIRDPFAANGLSITQPMEVLENGRTLLKTRLMHTSGEYIESTMMLPDIADPQKIGSAISYYRRYSLMSIAGLPAEDDDGNAAVKAVKENPTIDMKTLNSLNEYLNGHDALREEIKGKFGVLNLSNLKLSQIQEVRSHAKAYMIKHNSEKVEEK